MLYILYCCLMKYLKQNCVKINVVMITIHVYISRYHLKKCIVFNPILCKICLTFGILIKSKMLEITVDMTSALHCGVQYCAQCWMYIAHYWSILCI